MADVQCARCGTRSDGTYCPSCGALLRAEPCPRCGETPPPGASYCTRCGTRLEGRSASWLPWAVAGGALVLIGIASVFFMDDEAPGSRRVNLSAPAGATAPAARAGAPPPLTGTPREQADRLFNRIMEAFAAADTPQAVQFLPMGIDAYRLAEPLDADGLYHLSLLQTLGGQPSAGRATAERVLQGEPDHLLALAAAAEAAQAEGDAEAARRYWSRFLDALPERRESRPEYLQHQAMLPQYEASARAALGR